MRRRWYAVVPLLVLAPLLMAALPSSIENAVRGFFGESGRLSFVSFGERNQPPVSRPGECKFYMSRTTHAMRQSCNGSQWADSSAPGSSGTLVVADGQGGWIDSGCTVSDAIDGENQILTCDTIATRNQNNQGDGLVNAQSVYGNDANSVDGASCAEKCAEGDYCRLDADNSAAHRWVECEGATEVTQLSSGAHMYLPNTGSFSVGAGLLIPGTTNMSCTSFIPTYTLKDATKLAFNVSTADGTNTRLNVCIFDSTKTLIMGSSRCVGGTDAGEPCATDATCAGGGTCTSASAAATGVESFTGLLPTTLVQGKLYWICATSNSATSELTSIANGGVDNVIANTFVTRQGTIANTASGFCPLTFGTLSASQVEAPFVQISAE